VGVKRVLGAINSAIKPKKKMPEISTLSEFAALSQKKSAKIVRHTLNAGAVKEFCAEIARERFDALREQDAKKAERLTRWLNSGASKWLLREGRASQVEELANDAQPWAAEVLERGETLWSVILDETVLRQVGHIADWVADNAPRQLEQLSFEQAITETAEWDKRRSRLKARNEDWDGLTVVGDAPSAAPTYPNAQWVELKSAEALDREGVLMGHCVGSYAKHVAQGSTRIFSLRDETNNPLATIEARPMTREGIEEIASKEGWPKERMTAAFAAAAPFSVVQARQRFNMTLGHSEALAMNDLMRGFAQRGDLIAHVSESARNGQFSMPESAQLIPFSDLPAGTVVQSKSACVWRDDGHRLPENLTIPKLTITACDEGTRWPKKITVKNLELGAGVRFLDLSALPEWTVENVTISASGKMAGAKLNLGSVESVRGFGDESTRKPNEKGLLLAREKGIEKLVVSAGAVSLPGFCVDSLSVNLKQPADKSLASLALRFADVGELRLSAENNEKKSLVDFAGATVGRLVAEEAMNFSACEMSASFVREAAVDLSARSVEMHKEIRDTGNSPQFAERVAEGQGTVATKQSRRWTEEDIGMDIGLPVSYVLVNKLFKEAEESRKQLSTRQEGAMLVFKRDIVSVAESVGLWMSEDSAGGLLTGEQGGLAVKTRGPLLNLDLNLMFKEQVSRQVLARNQSVRKTLVAAHRLRTEGASAFEKLSEDERQAFESRASAADYFTLVNPNNDPSGLVVKNGNSAPLSDEINHSLNLLDQLLPENPVAQQPQKEQPAHEDRRAPEMAQPLTLASLQKIDVSLCHGLVALGWTLRSIDQNVDLGPLLIEMARDRMEENDTRDMEIRDLCAAVSQAFDGVRPERPKKFHEKIGKLAMNLDDLPPDSVCAKWLLSLSESVEQELRAEKEKNEGPAEASEGRPSEQQKKGPDMPALIADTLSSSTVAWASQSIAWAGKVWSSRGSSREERKRAWQVAAESCADVLDAYGRDTEAENLEEKNDNEWAVAELMAKMFGEGHGRAFTQAICMATINRWAQFNAAERNATSDVYGLGGLSWVSLESPKKADSLVAGLAQEPLFPDQLSVLVCESHGLAVNTKMKKALLGVMQNTAHSGFFLYEDELHEFVSTLTTLNFSGLMFSKGPRELDEARRKATEAKNETDDCAWDMSDRVRLPKKMKAPQAEMKSGAVPAPKTDASLNPQAIVEKPDTVKSVGASISAAPNLGNRPAARKEVVERTKISARADTRSSKIKQFWRDVLGR